MGDKLSTLSFKRTGGDMIEVKLSDGEYNPYFKEKAEINNKKQMLLLMKKLKEKGVSFPQSWLD